MTENKIIIIGDKVKFPPEINLLSLLLHKNIAYNNANIDVILSHIVVENNPSNIFISFLFLKFYDRIA